MEVLWDWQERKKMVFNSLMHIAFFTDQMEAMEEFYCDKLGLKKKVEVKYKVYLDWNDRPAMQKIAQEDPERVFNTYIELAQGQFIELFPIEVKRSEESVVDNTPGYSHFALLVDDIYAAKKQLLEAGVKIDTDISKGPSETYQMWIHDPDGNKFEIMQYTENSIQLKGNC